MGGHRATPVAADVSLAGFGFRLLSTHRFDSIEDRLGGRAPLGVIALVGAVAAVKGNVGFQVALQPVPRLAEGKTPLPTPW